MIGNVKALTRAEIDAPKQIARGEYGIFIHPTQVGAADIWKLPKPHPFRLVVPEDGVMLLTGGMSLLQGAPHPNAARVFMNYMLTRSAQQIGADDAGGPFIRRDVKPAVPELAHFATAKPFPEQPRHLRVRLEALLRVVGEGRALPEGGRAQEVADGDRRRLAVLAPARSPRWDGAAVSAGAMLPLALPSLLVADRVMVVYPLGMVRLRQLLERRPGQPGALHARELARRAVGPRHVRRAR